MKLYYPVRKPVIWNQRFGENATSVYKNLGLIGHNGIDFYALDGFPIYAAHDGVVTYTGHDGSGGLGVVLRGQEGTEYFKTIYWHLKEGSIKVKPDQQVKTGDLLALADNTGMSTGAHLHFGLKFIAQGEAEWAWFNLNHDNGYLGAIDPEPYFTGIHAIDVKITSIQEKVVELLKLLIDKLSKK